MKAFVTGATGFIGGALARRLLDDGWTLRLLVRDPTKAAALEGLGATLVPGDMMRPEPLQAAMDGCGAVFHCAAQVDVIKPDRAAILRNNVEGTRNVLAAAQAAGVPRVVHLSSVAAIGRKFESADETCWNDGDYASVYEESKHRSEQVALDFGKEGVDIVHVLPSVVLGPGDPKTGAFLKRYLRGKIPALLSRDGTLSFVHVDDLVDGILLAYEKGRPNERYIFSQATWTTTRLADEIQAATGVAPPRRIPVWLALAGAAVEEARAALTRRPPRVSRRAIHLAVRRYGYSSEKARRDLGWSPRDFTGRFHDTIHYWQREVEQRAIPA